MKHYDYVLVGSGLYAGVFAWYAKKNGKTCLVVEKRDHIGGNIYCEDVEGIHVHSMERTSSILRTKRYGIIYSNLRNSTGIRTVRLPDTRMNCIICLLI